MEYSVSGAINNQLKERRQVNSNVLLQLSRSHIGDVHNKVIVLTQLACPWRASLKQASWSFKVASLSLSLSTYPAYLGGCIPVCNHPVTYLRVRVLL